MITVRQKGDYAKLTKYLKRVHEVANKDILEKYGQIGVEALKNATPVDSGETANSWYYVIYDTQTRGTAISFRNSHIEYSPNGLPVNIAIILQYGHATRNGGWVEGVDYINPALRPVFEKIAREAWEEVTRV